jgi:hypothetical protein
MVSSVWIIWFWGPPFLVINAGNGIAGHIGY